MPLQYEEGRHIDVGTWINHSKGPILGATLTLEPRYARLLVAFIAIYVTATGTQLWAIFRFFVHSVRYSDQPRDILHHQQQLQIRNAGSPGGAMWVLVKMGWTWKGNLRRSLLRLSPLLSMLTTYSILLALAGIFSSTLAQNGGEALLLPNECGFINLRGNGTGSELFKGKVASKLWITSMLRSGLTYARTCYGKQDIDYTGGRLCHSFPTSVIGRLNVASTPCPFESSICSNTSLRLDSGLIASEDLGFNFRPVDQIYFRTVATWSPISVANRTASARIRGENATIYNLGSVPPSNWSFVIPRSEVISSRQINVRANWFINRNLRSAYSPIEELMPSNADLAIISIGNHARYVSPVQDPIFSATSATPADDGSNLTMYTASTPSTILSIVQQYQYCASPDESSCSSLAGFYGGVSNPSAFTPNQLDIVEAISLALGNLHAGVIMSALGSEALLATDFNLGPSSGVTMSLPDTQWQKEAEYIFNTTLASLQIAVAEYPSVRRIDVDPQNRKTTLDYMIPLDQWQTVRSADMMAAVPGGIIPGLYPRKEYTIGQFCSKLKVRSFDHTSFPLLSLGLVIGFGVLITIVALVLPHIFNRYIRRSPSGIRKRQDWDALEVFHLQRQLLEAKGVGPWVAPEDGIPVPQNRDMKWTTTVRAYPGIVTKTTAIPAQISEDYVGDSTPLVDLKMTAFRENAVPKDGDVGVAQQVPLYQPQDAYHQFLQRSSRSSPNFR